jgi:hypothetical protein
MHHTALDRIIRGALNSLVEDLNRQPWRGRERELVSLFAFHISFRSARLPGLRCALGRSASRWPSPSTRHMAADNVRQ